MAAWQAGRQAAAAACRLALHPATYPAAAHKSPSGVGQLQVQPQQHMFSQRYQQYRKPHLVAFAEAA